jgi:hypothetical protein
MDLVEKIKEQRTEKVKFYLREAQQHGSSRHRDIEADGADAHKHGYGTGHNPYVIGRQAVDAAGFYAPLRQAEFEKSAAWLFGWLKAEEIAVNS